MVFTSSNVFIQTLVDAGITHAFVNLGSDHPALLEALSERTKQSLPIPEIITSPNEMVALSAAQGYAQVTGRPAAVIVHVDCGTQALAGAVHNVDRCRTPVLIYAGAAPYTIDGELQGSRNEFIFTLQDIPDQSAIVRQYMRHTALIRTGRNISQVLLRALSFATSEPKGPSYVYAGREATEEFLSEEEEGKKAETLRKAISSGEWSPLEKAGLNSSAVSQIGRGLLEAKRPLIITSYLGRNPAAVSALSKLSTALALPIYLACPTVVNIPWTHENLVSIGYGMGKNEWIENADVVLVIDSDIPWIPLHCKPKEDTTIYHIDVDPLKENVNVFHIPAKVRAKADGELALTQLLDFVNAEGLETSKADIQSRTGTNANAHAELMKSIADEETKPHPDGLITVPAVLASLRSQMTEKTLILNEGISNYPLIWKHLQVTTPGKMLTSGGSSLGWGLGAAVGAALGEETMSAGGKSDLRVLVVGDGTYLFGVPSSAFWMARRYSTPFLTIVLNNGGWKSPRLSMLGVHPEGVGASMPSKAVHVTFGPDAPDYGGIAEAAGGAWKAILKDPKDVDRIVKEAVEVVKGGRSAVLDVWTEKF